MPEIEEIPPNLPNNQLVALVTQRLSYYKECILETRYCVLEFTCSTLSIERAIVTISKMVSKLSESEKEAFENLKKCRLKILRAFAKSDKVVSKIKWLAERLFSKLTKVKAGDSQEEKERKCAKAIDDFEENVKTQLQEVQSVCMEFEEISETHLEINIAIEKLKDFIEFQQIQLKTQIGSEISKARICYIAAGAGNKTKLTHLFCAVL